MGSCRPLQLLTLLSLVLQRHLYRMVDNVRVGPCDGGHPPATGRTAHDRSAGRLCRRERFVPLGNVGYVVNYQRFDKCFVEICFFLCIFRNLLVSRHVQ